MGQKMAVNGLFKENLWKETYLVTVSPPVRPKIKPSMNDCGRVAAPPAMSWGQLF